MSRPVPNFKSVILRQRLDEIRLRVLGMSKFNVEEDRQKLVELREQAHAIGDSDLELFALNIYGLTHTVLGEDDAALVIFQEGALRAQELQNLDRWVTFQLNQGVIYSARRQLAEARRIFEAFIPALMTFATNVDSVTRLQYTYCNLAVLCVAMRDFEAAEQYARYFLDKWESPEVSLIQPARRVEMMSMARDALSSVHLERGEYAQARSQAGLMLGISLREAHPLETVAAYLALLRVSIFAPDPDSIESDWQRAVDVIDQQLLLRAPVLWRVGSEVLMRDARMYQYRGKLEWARRCAEKALEIMQTLRNDEHIQIIETFLAELSS